MAVGVLMALGHEERQRPRRLSHVDTTFWKGRLQLPPNVSNVTKRWTYIHVPKTAGESFMTDSTFYMPNGTVLKGNLERSLARSDQMYPIINFLRQPTSHVLSQFLECKYDNWGKWTTEGTRFPGRGKLPTALGGFDEWIEHFVNISKHGIYGGNHSFKCYDPFNMQSRYLTANSSLGAPHFAQGPEHRMPPIDQAKSTLASQIEVVGIVEYYAESLCLFEYHALGGHIVTRACRVCNRTANPPRLVLATNGKLTHRSHNVPPHSIQMISNRTKALIEGEMTMVDQELYEFGLELFMQDVDAIRNATGIDLLCRVLDDSNPKATATPTAADVASWNSTATSSAIPPTLTTNQTLGVGDSSQSLLLTSSQPIFSTRQLDMEYELAVSMVAAVAGVMVVFMFISRRMRGRERNATDINDEDQNLVDPGLAVYKSKADDEDD